MRDVLAAAVAVVYGIAFLDAQARAPRPGDPLAGISTAEFAEFRLGLDDFLEVETADEGLGPAFNGTSCAVCHNIPAVGGVGTIAELRAVGRNEQGELDPALRVRRDAASALFGADARLSGEHSGRGRRDRAADPDSALRRRTRRGDSRRHRARA